MRAKEKTKDVTHITFSPFLITSTGNEFGDTGATSLSDALKSNTTLTTLNLSGEDKRKKTHKRHPSTIHSSFLITLTDNGKFGDSGAVPLSEALKSNTTLTKLDLSSEDKRRAIHMTRCLSLVTNLVKSIGTYIHPKGGVALSEALKVNSSLTDLNLDSHHKKKTYMISCSFFFICRINRLFLWTIWRDSIERGIKGQHNTHKTQSGW